jgi:uncharacterized protein YkwD
MFWALAAVIALHLAAGVTGGSELGTCLETNSNSLWHQTSASETPTCDINAELQLLNLVNIARADAGLQPLKLDEGLLRAARAHAAQMALQDKLSHQFPEEPSLEQRISANSSLVMKRTGENVAVAPTLNDAHKALMASSPHRNNLLNAHYNLAGFAIFHRGNRLYIAQDFGSSAGR